ncbi:MAG: ATP-binding protein [Deltaproteobacteria bacterium]|nr:ATP-binding protein [Deltaproteobacteria bacterium]MDH3801784.1 ATP-binding protein [Deltaproteobacteria bacterium]MDH3852770.1 ATP-binding protein [Deltaproteobacteria bacterium]MDH3899186.1 ATP-binding protein [Deltaproteobacteria bacterium]MDH3926708.1 ATP-binding protein [Deltaproteobacteria bacterium]
MANTLSISFANDMQELTHVLQVVNVFLEPRALPSKLVYAVNLILEEILMNIIKYGYDDGESHEIEVQIEVEQEEVALTVIDDGREFNPLTVPPPDHSKSAMDRLEEGLGLQFVRHMRNAIEYRREEDKNILKIWMFL